MVIDFTLCDCWMALCARVFERCELGFGHFDWLGLSLLIVIVCLWLFFIATKHMFPWRHRCFPPGAEHDDVHCQRSSCLPGGKPSYIVTSNGGLETDYSRLHICSTVIVIRNIHLLQFQGNSVYIASIYYIFQSIFCQQKEVNSYRTLISVITSALYPVKYVNICIYLYKDLHYDESYFWLIRAVVFIILYQICW